jgi:hypothetical protein
MFGVFTHAGAILLVMLNTISFAIYSIAFELHYNTS